MIRLFVLISYFLFSISIVYAKYGFVKLEDGIVYGLAKDKQIYFLEDKISYVFQKVKQVENINKYTKRYERVQLRSDMLFKNANFSRPIIEKVIHSSMDFGKNKEVLYYEKVIYKEIYDHIDLVMYWNSGRPKYDLIVHPGGNPNDIYQEFLGVENVEQLSKTKILLNTKLGEWRKDIPESYQLYGGKKQPVSVSFMLEGSALKYDASSFDRSRDLVIDPYGTFIGASAIDECYGAVLNSHDEVVAAGFTLSPNFPVQAGVLDTTIASGFDCFVSSIASNGTLKWSGYISGSQDDFCYKVVGDHKDNVYVVGYTLSPDLAMSPNCFQSVHGGSYDGFVYKISKEGNVLWSTYFGGSGPEFNLAASVDPNNQLVVGGFTASPDLPGATNVNQGGLDGYIAKFTESGALSWAAYIGGSATEDIHALTCDSLGNIIGVGETFSTDFPVTSGAYQSIHKGGADIFIAKWDSLGNQVFSTYFGGADSEDATAVSTAPDGRIYIGGYSKSIDIPLVGNTVYQNVHSSTQDALIVLMDSSGNVQGSTLLGGDLQEKVDAMIFKNDKLYMVCNTWSTDIVQVGSSWQMGHNGNQDMLLVRMDSVLNPQLISYFGTSNSDAGWSIDLDTASQLVIGGSTSGSDFYITPDAMQQTLSGEVDGFVVRLDTATSIITSINTENGLNPKTSFVFPNPTDDLVFFDKNIGTAMLFNASGEKVANFLLINSATFSFKKNDLPSGTYTFVFSDENGVNTRQQVVYMK